MARGIELGIAIPQTFLGATAPRPPVRAFLSRAETLGFSSAWVVDPVLGRMPSLEPVTLLSYAAAATQRMRLGAAVLLTALRSPVHLAKSLSTLDVLSDGRLDVGVGLGGNARVYPAFGLGPERRAARFAESVTVMKRLWTEPRVTFHGEFCRLDDVAMEPKPVQRPHPPVWFGAHHPNALRRAVQLGDAFMGAGSIGTAPFAEEVRLLRSMLEAAGRDPATFPIGKRVYLAVDADRGRAAKRLGEWFGAFYGRPEMAEQVSVWGDAQACVDALQAVIAAGARSLLLNPVFDEAEQMERLAEIAPKLTV